MRPNYRNSRKPYERPRQADALLQIDAGFLLTLSKRHGHGWPEKALNPYKTEQLVSIGFLRRKDGKVLVTDEGRAWLRLNK